MIKLWNLLRTIKTHCIQTLLIGTKAGSEKGNLLEKIMAIYSRTSKHQYRLILACRHCLKMQQDIIIQEKDMKGMT